MNMNWCCHQIVSTKSAQERRPLGWWKGTWRFWKSKLLRLHHKVISKWPCSTLIQRFHTGAQIILLPEDGIHGYGHISRQTLRPFLEYVPPVADGSVPCYEDGVDDAYVSSRLSCLALENNIWIAAAYGSVVPGCEHCSHGGECMFNTLVVFSSNGSIAGVYHKYNLWTSELGRNKEIRKSFIISLHFRAVWYWPRRTQSSDSWDRVWIGGPVHLCWPHVAVSYCWPGHGVWYWQPAAATLLVGPLPPSAGAQQWGRMGKRSSDQCPVCQHPFKRWLEHRQWHLLQQWTCGLPPWLDTHCQGSSTHWRPGHQAW